MGRRGRKCCCDESTPCNVVILRDGTDWAGWTNPPPDTGDGSGFGDVPSGTTTSIIHPRTSCNWTVDIQLDHQVPMEGAKIVVGYPTSTTFLSAEWVVSDTSDAKIQLSLEGVFQDSYYLTMNVAYWLRFIEGNDLDGDRHYTIEVWDTDPNADGSNVVHSSCYCQPAEACDAARQDVEIEIAASATADFPVGTVRAGDTFYDNSVCPDPTCGNCDPCTNNYTGTIQITITIASGCSCPGTSISYTKPYGGLNNWPLDLAAEHDNIAGPGSGDYTCNDTFNASDFALRCANGWVFDSLYLSNTITSEDRFPCGYEITEALYPEVISHHPLHLRALGVLLGAVSFDPCCADATITVDIEITEAP